MLDNLMCSSLALLAQTIIYGVNACNNAIEVSVGLKGLVANLVFRSRQSLPLQREVWRDCLYGRGLFRETHKKMIALCYPSCDERKTRLEPTMLVGNSRELYLHPQPLEGASGVTSGEVCFNAKRKKDS